MHRPAGLNPLAVTDPSAGPNANSPARQSTVTVTLHTDTTAAFDDIEWDALYSPDGGLVGVADYEDYAEVRFNTGGTYILQASGIRNKAIVARDTVTITVQDEVGP